MASWQSGRGGKERTHHTGVVGRRGGGSACPVGLGQEEVPEGKLHPWTLGHSIGSRVNVREEGLAEEHLGRTNPSCVTGKGLLASLFLRLCCSNSACSRWLCQQDWGSHSERGGDTMPVCPSSPLLHPDFPKGRTCGPLLPLQCLASCKH